MVSESWVLYTVEKVARGEAMLFSLGPSTLAAAWKHAPEYSKSRHESDISNNNLPWPLAFRA
jgi:hypothetical protein